jgi:hypothetical protein
MTVKKAASTRGTGRNSIAGMRGPSCSSHHGAHSVDNNVVGGTIARLRATSHWTMRSARYRALEGSSSRRRRMSVVRPKGRDPTTRKGTVGNGTVRKSPFITRICRFVPMRSRNRPHQAESGSIARTCAPRRANATVIVPEPAPISTISSPRRRATCSTRRSAVAALRKFCPRWRRHSSRTVRLRADTEEHHEGHNWDRRKLALTVKSPLRGWYSPALSLAQAALRVPPVAARAKAWLTLSSVSEGSD